MSYSADDLFRTSGKLEAGNKTLYMRTLGAVEENEREYWLNAEGVRLLRALRDPSTDVHQSYIAALDLADRDGLIAIIQSSRALELWNQAQEMIYAKGETEPTSHATIGEVVNVAEENDAAATEIEQERFRTYQALMETVKEDLDKFSDADLRKKAVPAQESQVVQAQRVLDWRSYTLYAVLYRDGDFKRRYFKSPGDAANADGGMKEKLLAKYQEMDRFSKDQAEALVFLDV